MSSELKIKKSTKFNPTTKLCEICTENRSKYACPRCNIFYCSLPCYKAEKHSQCSESFYKDCVTEALSDNSVDSDSKAKMIEILKKYQTESNTVETNFASNTLLDDEESDGDSDDEAVPDLHDRLKGLNINNANEVWQVLTPDERNDFEAFLNTGDVSKFMPQWLPWWMFREQDKLVEEVGKSEDESNPYNEALKKCPTIIEVPEFGAIKKQRPSNSVKFNIMNVLGSYAFLMRYFNGDCDPYETAVYMFILSSNLRTNQVFEDEDNAVKSIELNCFESPLIETDEYSLDIMKEDLYKIMLGPRKDNHSYYCLAALSDLHGIFKKATKLKSKESQNIKSKTNGGQLKTYVSKNSTPTTEENTKYDNNVDKHQDFTKRFPDSKREHLPELDIAKTKASVKKLEFYLSYVQCFGMPEIELYLDDE